jgi:hypothetical protein
MKVIIAGSREITNYQVVLEAIAESGFEITEVVCGMARGIDLLGKRWADENGIPVKPFPAKWEKYGRTHAGRLRNTDMKYYADALIAIHDGESTGTKDMIGKMERAGKPVYVKICNS